MVVHFLIVNGASELQPVMRGPGPAITALLGAQIGLPIFHQVANVGTDAYRVMDAEVIGTCSAAPLPGNGSPEPVLENAKVEVVRWRLEPGQSATFGRACALLIAVEPAQLLIDEGRGTLAADWEKGSYGWRDAQSEWSVANRGPSATHLVEIRFK